MSHASLTRRVRFSARHRFWNSEWDAAENAKVFGASADTRYHGHDYACDVTIRGRPDSRSGMVMDLGELDRILAREVRDRFDRKTINEDVPEFVNGRLSPTGENLARFIFERVERELPRPVRVTRVTVGEDDTLSATYTRD